MQRLSPTKTYTKDFPQTSRQNDVIAKVGESLVPVASSVSAVDQAHSSHISPGQVFSSLKASVPATSSKASGTPTNASAVTSPTVMQGEVASHLSAGQVVSALNTGASNLGSVGSTLSTKEISQQVFALDTFPKNPALFLLPFHITARVILLICSFHKICRRV